MEIIIGFIAVFGLIAWKIYKDTPDEWMEERRSAMRFNDHTRGK